MSFSDDDMRFACGTQKRMLMVYEFRGPGGWELQNKFKFNDWFGLTVFVTIGARHS
ncbi:hypothetical protein ABW20_dc0103903 [Dactylellina cionopaga]|nr:hypothetical protein ABW20_dc0103903 [Dactylellina cionopaga]